MRKDCVIWVFQLWSTDVSGGRIETYGILNNIYDPDMLPYIEPCSTRNTPGHSKQKK